MRSSKCSCGALFIEEAELGPAFGLGSGERGSVRSVDSKSSEFSEQTGVYR